MTSGLPNLVCDICDFLHHDTPGLQTGSRHGPELHQGRMHESIDVIRAVM